MKNAGMCIILIITVWEVYVGYLYFTLPVASFLCGESQVRMAIFLSYCSLQKPAKFTLLATSRRSNH